MFQGLRSWVHLLAVMGLIGNMVPVSVLIADNLETSNPTGEFRPELQSQVMTQVSAKSGWQATPFNATVNQGVSLKVVGGQWTHWLGNVPYNRGIGGYYICAEYLPPSKCVEPMPEVAQGNLIGRIGSQLFEIRTGTTIIAQQAGTLYLRINDAEVSFYDNDGVLSVLISPVAGLSGRITSPPDGYVTGPATIQLQADAWGSSGVSVSQVEFFVLYDGSWHSVGTDASSPYQIPWQIPYPLKTQQLWVRIDVVGESGQRVEYAGGLRRVSYYQSIGDSSVVENWIPFRPYLNQRSLSPDGDSKCSVASMSMILAMNGLISADYQTMANKANEMYPRVLFRGAAYVYTIRNELRRQGATSQYNDGEAGEITKDTGWSILKREVNAGRPVIVRTLRGVLTNAGHYFVAVGYRESNRGNNVLREVIAYDPYGKWRGFTCAELGNNCSNNYDRNTTKPEGGKGQWVYYDFDKVFGSYVITASRGNTAEAHIPTAAVTIPNPPDVISDEPENIGTYDGVETGGDMAVLLPLIMR